MRLARTQRTGHDGFVLPSPPNPPLAAAPHLLPPDLHGIARLAAEATLGMTDVVEAMHASIWPLSLLGACEAGRTAGITGFVYRRVRGVTRMAERAAEALLAPLARDAGAQAASSFQRDAVIAALNGVLGDHLAASGNPLALHMQLRRHGRPLDDAQLRAEAAAASGRCLVLIHGLCMNDRLWQRQSHDHGARLSAELGYVPAYLRYNTGLHISHNGRQLAQRLEALVAAPDPRIEELVLIGHSMGGLVARSACHYAGVLGHSWPRRLRGLICLGSPHHGTRMERGGNGIDQLLGAAPVAAPLARLGRIRSAGITDLRHGNLRDEDWAGYDRFAGGGDRRAPLPLPREIDCYAIAASTGRQQGDVRDRLFGDGLVTLDSALGRHRDPQRSLDFPEAHRRIVYGSGHLDLLGRCEIYEQIRDWLIGPGRNAH